MDRLIIIGNGFDLAHGYKTTYKHFSESVDHEALQIFELLTQKYCSEDILSGGFWYNFEEMINSMVKNWFYQLETLNWPQFDQESETADAMHLVYRNIQKDMNIFPLIMRQIEGELFQYLVEETRHNQDYRLESIRGEFEKQSLVLSFNYTDVAERYSNEIFYVHGSLKENHIVLGHPPDQDMPCVAPVETTLMDKARLRDKLGLVRHIKEHGSSRDKENQKRLMKEYETYQNSIFSHDGEYREIDQLSQVTRGWIARTKEEQPYLMQKFDTENIKDMIIIGHSIHSDSDIFDQLLETFSRLTNILIYTYPEENKVHLSKKIKYFTDRDLMVSTTLY